MLNAVQPLDFNIESTFSASSFLNVPRFGSCHSIINVYGRSKRLLTKQKTNFSIWIHCVNNIL